MVKKKLDIPIDTGLQDGLLAYYLTIAPHSDANVEKRIEKEPFTLYIKDNGLVDYRWYKVDE